MSRGRRLGIRFTPSCDFGQGSKPGSKTTRVTTPGSPRSTEAESSLPDVPATPPSHASRPWNKPRPEEAPVRCLLQLEPMSPNSTEVGAVPQGANKLPGDPLSPSWTHCLNLCLASAVASRGEGSLEVSCLRPSSSQIRVATSLDLNWAEPITASAANSPKSAKAISRLRCDSRSLVRILIAANQSPVSGVPLRESQ